MKEWNAITDEAKFDDEVKWSVRAALYMSLSAFPSVRIDLVLASVPRIIIGALLHL